MYSKIRACRNCTLCDNQPPLLQNSKQADVMWVGLSAVRVSSVDHDEPLSQNTKSGKLINEIEMQLDEVSFYRTNLVKCLPLNSGKIRYPTSKEAIACFQNLLLELSIIKPKFVFLLGKQVSDFVQRKFGVEPKKPCHIYDYQPLLIRDTHVVAIHHPSYILIYKRQHIAKYVKAIQHVIDENRPKVGQCSVPIGVSNRKHSKTSHRLPAPRSF